MIGAFLVVLTALVLGALLGNLHAPPKLRLRQFGRVRGDFFCEHITRAGIPLLTAPAAGPICSRPLIESLYDTDAFTPRGENYYLSLFQNFNSFPGLFAPVARDSVNLRPLGRMRPYRPAPYTFAQLERMKRRP